MVRNGLDSIFSIRVFVGAVILLLEGCASFHQAGVPVDVSQDARTVPPFEQRLRKFCSEEYDTPVLTKSPLKRKRIQAVVGNDRRILLGFSANTTESGITVGNPMILGPTLVKVGDKFELNIKPLRPGSTTIGVRDEVGEMSAWLDVDVHGTDLCQLAHGLQASLSGMRGIVLNTDGERVLIDGEFMSPDDFGKASVVARSKGYSDYVTLLAGLSPKYWKTLASRIQTEIQKTSPTIRVRALGDVILLEGTARSVDERSLAERKARIMFPEILPESNLDRDIAAQRPAKPLNLIQDFVTILK